MTKSKDIPKKSECNWVLVEHKRGVARMCCVCGKIRYYGKHTGIKLSVDHDGSIMVYTPGVVALAHGETH